MPQSKGRQLHANSLKLREQKKFLESLQLDEEALSQYAKDKDGLGFSELLSMHAKTYIHEFDFTGFKPYLLLAKHVAMAAVDIAEDSGEKSETILPYFNLGEVAYSAGDLELAIKSYKRAVDGMHLYPSERHNRKSVLANFEIHLATSEYENGDKVALAKAEKALKDLEDSSDASDYELAVWLSGGHMRIAKMLKKDNLEKAKEHLAEAKKIVDSNPDLKIRKEQWEKLNIDF